MNRYEHLLYRRGWIFVSCAEVKVTVPDYWISTAVPAGLVLHDPDVVVASALDSGGRSVTTVGTPQLAYGNTYLSSPNRVCAMLLDGLSCGVDTFQGLLDHAFGRYVVIRHDGEHVCVQQDALGLRQTFVTAPHLARIIGSHPALVASAVGAQRSHFGQKDFAKKQRLFALPGQETEYVGIMALTPNTELDLLTGLTRRITPVLGSEVDDPDKVIDAFISSVRRRIAAWTEDGGQFMLSLSAGLDSRVSLALLRPFASDLLSFTYDLSYKDKNRANAHDTEGALALARRAGIEHQLLYLPTMEADRDFLRVLGKNRWKPHSATVARAYLEQLPSSRIHLRSNGFEIIRRAMTVHRHADTSILSADTMLAVASKGNSHDPSSRDAFQRFIDATHFPREDGSDLDPRDLFYWEYRMGVWLPHIVMESDIAHDTDILLNSRYWIAALTRSSYALAPAHMDRRELLHRMIERAWPELLKTDVNGIAIT